MLATGMPCKKSPDFVFFNLIESVIKNEKNMSIVVLFGFRFKSISVTELCACNFMYELTTYNDERATHAKITGKFLKYYKNPH